MRGLRGARGLPRVSAGGRGGRAAPGADPAREGPENVRPGQSWGAGGRGGRSPAPLPPSPDKWAAGRRRAGGRQQPADERGPPVPVPPPHPALPAGGGCPGLCRTQTAASPEGPGWASPLFLLRPSGRLTGGRRPGWTGRGGRVEGRRPGQPGPADAGSSAPQQAQPWFRQAGGGGRDSRGSPWAPFPFPPSAAGGAGGFSPAATPSLPPRHGRSPTAARDGREPEGEEPGRLVGQPRLGAAPQPQPPLLLPLAW